MSWLLTLLLSAAPAAEIAGVTLDDTTTVGGEALVLNGAGLREFLWIDIYVGGLYLPAKTTSAKEAIEADVPKRVVMHFIFRKVGRKRIVDTFEDGLGKQEGLSDKYRAELDQLISYIEGDAKAGDRVLLDYVPGQGITLTVGGKTQGPVGDAGFMKGIWSIFLGDHPASDKLKTGMLGG